MRWARAILFLFGFFFLAFAGSELHADPTSHPITGGVSKVLPLYVDLKGQVAPSPSLFDRDAYQFSLLTRYTNQISGIRFDVLWKARNARGLNLKLRLDLRGIGKGGFPTQTNLEQIVTPKLFHHWASLTLAGQNYKNFGALVAWHATLWNGGQLIGEQQSFLW
jgi:hypothetical protein